MRREMQHDGKIQAYHGQKIGELEQRIKALEKNRHSSATSAGIAKKKVQKLKEELSRRH